MSDHDMLIEATQEACRARMQRLQAALGEQGVDALLVNSEKDIMYLSGFVGHDSLLLVSPAQAVIVSDNRYDEFLDPWRSSGFCEVVMGIRHRLEETIREQCAGGSISRLGIQAEYLTVARRAKIGAALTGIDLVETTGVVGTLRMCKDPLEVSRIEQAIAWQEAALEEALRRVVPGMTEQQLLAHIEFEMKSRGAFGPSFDCILGAGPNSSIPHHQTGSTPITPGTLLIDWGAMSSDGYNGDLTRTFAIGAFPDKIREIYDIVLEAQVAAIDAAGPGQRCADIDKVARDIITNAGYGEQFGHGLGHGLGLEVHEDPYFNNLSDVVLAPGMVMTVEPGIYLPGVGGVRIEDDILITESGNRVLSSYPKDRDSMILEPAEAAMT
jgi:Xaa-Pro aminopeptidase